jgi:GNAT superfamily N-acetyltransferase
MNGADISKRPARRATVDDVADVVNILATSHEHYVWEEWLLPHDDRFADIERIMNLTTRLVAIPCGEVWLVEGCSAAVWLPPEPEAPPPEHQRELATTFAAVFGERTDALTEVDAAVHDMRPADRHWTLGTMGTSPARQSSGFGAAVLEPRLTLLDEASECAALDTSTETNVAFYERFGFAVVAYDDQLPHGAPPVWTMWRDPQ